MSGLVEIHNLTKTYDKKKEALHDLTLTLPRGKIIGLLGPNGSGKTTLIKLLNGLLVPDSGEILIDGEKPGPSTKAKVSYLPERTYLKNGATIRELVSRIFMRISGLTGRRKCWPHFRSKRMPGSGH